MKIFLVPVVVTDSDSVSIYRDGRVGRCVVGVAILSADPVDLQKICSRYLLYQTCRSSSECMPVLRFCGSASQQVYWNRLLKFRIESSFFCQQNYGNCNYHTSSLLAEIFLVSISPVDCVYSYISGVSTPTEIGCPSMDDVECEQGAIYRDEANILADSKQPISRRMDTCFILKRKGDKNAINSLAYGLFRSDSDLLKHEICYVMGQMRLKEAIPILTKVLIDAEGRMAPVVRHEAGEALAAIGDFSVIPLLLKYAEDECREVAETCRLGADGLLWQKENGKIDVSKAHSVDPAPAEPLEDVSALEKTLLDTSIPLFKRYRAMFALRDINTPASIESLAKSLKDDSALLRHEVCFVLGQMKNPASIPALKAVLADLQEHEMVRHEAAEALGEIATEECVEILKPYAKDDKPVVSESIGVALGIANFWKEPEE